MKGSYHIRVENKRLRYDLDIRRNITIIRGDSATGKTTLIEMLQSAEKDGTASGVSLSCDKPCVVLDRIRWEENLEMIHNSIVFLDEQNHFMESKEFAVKIRESDNYYVLITRAYLSNLPYSVDEIYGIRESGKYLHLNKSYHELYRIYEDRFMQSQPDCMMTEDSNSGFEFFRNLFSDYMECLSASGKSNLYQKILNSGKKKSCLVIADGAAFGPEMERIVSLARHGYRLLLFLPESFEWIVLKAGIIKDRQIEDILECPENYIESSRYFSWERFFTDLLTQETRNTYLRYTKSHLNPVYLQDHEKQKIVDMLPEQIRCIVKEE